MPKANQNAANFSRPPKRQNLPEKRVMLNGDLPQSLGGLVCGELETDRCFHLLEFAGTNLDEERRPSVADLQDFRPAKSVRMAQSRASSRANKSKKAPKNRLV